MDKAHQRIIREHRAKEESSMQLFGHWWESLNLSVDTAEVKYVDYNTAKQIILKYEWLGTMPTGCKFSIGLYIDRALAAVECFTDSKAGSKYSLFGYPALCLARGACVHWAPAWAASYLIQKSIKLIDPALYDIVIAYADTDAGEIGTVYQAANWYCIGTVSNIFWLSPKGERFDQRHHRDLSKEKINEKNKVLNNNHIIIKEKLLNEGWQYATGGIRYRYAQVVGNGKEKRKIRKMLEAKSVPYPKRDKFQERNALFPIGKAGGGSPVPLQLLRAIENGQERP